MLSCCLSAGIWSAALDGDLERVSSLVQKGTDPNLKDSAGYTALVSARARAWVVERSSYVITIEGLVLLSDDFHPLTETPQLMKNRCSPRRTHPQFGSMSMVPISISFVSSAFNKVQLLVVSLRVVLKDLVRF